MWEEAIMSCMLLLFHVHWTGGRQEGKAVSPYCRCPQKETDEGEGQEKADYSGKS